MKTTPAERAIMRYQAYARYAGIICMGRQIDDRRFIEVQIRADGDHRATHFVDDAATGTPTHFRTLAEMKRALSVWAA